MNTYVATDARNYDVGNGAARASPLGRVKRSGVHKPRRTSFTRMSKDN